MSTQNNMSKAPSDDPETWGWRKSWYSHQASNDCVEVGDGPGVFGVRDTQNRDLGHLAFRAPAWAGFLKALK